MYTYTLPEDIKATTLVPRTIEQFRLREDYLANMMTGIVPERSSDKEIIAKLAEDKPDHCFIDNSGIKLNIRRWVKATISKFNISSINSRNILKIDTALLEIYNIDEIRSKIVVKDDREVIPAGTEIVTDVDICQLFRTAAKIAKRQADEEVRCRRARIDEDLKTLVIE